MNCWIYDLLNVYAEYGIEDHIEPKGSIPKYHNPVNTNGAEKWKEDQKWIFTILCKAAKGSLWIICA